MSWITQAIESRVSQRVRLLRWGFVFLSITALAWWLA